MHYKTIVLSDLHLGAKASKAKEALFFLKKNSCDTLILNGDIIDGWQLRRGCEWKKSHSNFLKKVFQLSVKNKSEIIYIRGNHDDFLDTILPFKLGLFSIRKLFIYQGVNRKYLVTHGDMFDSITSKMRWLSKLGDIGYTLLLKINSYYNKNRIKRGLPYDSISQRVKSRVKSVVSYISDFEMELSKYAKMKGCDGVICGHIHQPANKIINNVLYLNSGDWVESLSALTEDHYGNWEIIYYYDWVKQFDVVSETPLAADNILLAN